MRTISGKRYATHFIQTREPFITRSKNFRGEGSKNTYLLYSYRTMIAEYWEGVWYINDTIYSSETSKHQWIVRHAIGDYDWVNNAIHVDHLPRGVGSIWAYAIRSERRADRIRSASRR